MRTDRREQAFKKALDRYDRVTAKAVLDAAFGVPEPEPSIDAILRRVK